MTTMDNLRAVTKSEVTVKDKKRVTIVFDPDVSVGAAVQSLKKYFGGHEKQKAVKLVLGSEELGYFLRTDLYDPKLKTRSALDGSAGATLPGSPRGVTFIELCCPTAGCQQVLLVPRYDKNHPEKCDEHGTAMERCK